MAFLASVLAVATTLLICEVEMVSALICRPMAITLVSVTTVFGRVSDHPFNRVIVVLMLNSRPEGSEVSTIDILLMKPVESKVIDASTNTVACASRTAVVTLAR